MFTFMPFPCIAVLQRLRFSIRVLTKSYLSCVKQPLQLVAR